MDKKNKMDKKLPLIKMDYWKNQILILSENNFLSNFTYLAVNYEQ
jgi:hypothetical protein